MVKEINRNGWSKFCKTFNSTNQYRHANVNIVDKAHGERGVYSDLSFLGIGLEKNGRTIEGINLFAGRWDPEKMLEPVLCIKEPVRLTVDRDENGRDRFLRVKSTDGTEARIELYGEKDPNMLVEKVAYSIFERRGFSYGNDMGDWYEAQKIVKEAEEQLTR